MIPDSYFDQFATKKYRSKNPLQRALIRRFVGQLHGLFVAANPVRTVLEVGCGEGFLSGYLSQKFPEKRFTGVDLDAGDLDALRAKFPAIQAHQGSAYDLSFLGETFDLVICAEVLEHLEEPERALDQFLSLQPRYALLTVPHEPWFMLSNLLRGKNITRFGNDIEHINHWGKRSFGRLLSSRFDVAEIGSSYPWLLALAVPKAR